MAYLKRKLSFALSQENKTRNTGVAAASPSFTAST
jgi:hypothetical protein